MTRIDVRPACLSDAHSIAKLHVSIWRETYRDLAPCEVFRALDEPLRLGRWIEILSNPSPDQAVLLAEVGGRIVGLGAAGAPSHEGSGDRGEVRSLHVDPRFQRLGVGRTLIQRLAQHLVDPGFRGVALGVVVGTIQPSLSTRAWAVVWRAFHRPRTNLALGEFHHRVE